MSAVRFKDVVASFRKMTIANVLAWLVATYWGAILVTSVVYWSAHKMLHIPHNASLALMLAQGSVVMLVCALLVRGIPGGIWDRANQKALITIVLAGVWCFYPAMQGVQHDELVVVIVGQTSVTRALMTSLITCGIFLGLRYLVLSRQQSRKTPQL